MHKIASEWPSRPVPTCAQCAPGLFKPSAGNEACEGCAARQFLNETSHVCSPCPIGTFGPVPTPWVSKLHLLPARHVWQFHRTRPCGAVRKMPGRVHRPIAKRGYRAEQPRHCAQCEAGKYSELPGLPDPTHCTECPAGHFRRQSPRSLATPACSAPRARTRRSAGGRA